VRAPFLVSSYRTFQLTLVLVYAIALLGLNILTATTARSPSATAPSTPSAPTARDPHRQAGAPYWRWCPPPARVPRRRLPVRLPRCAWRALPRLATFALGVAMPQLLKYHHLEKWTGGVQGIVIAKPEAPSEFRWRRTSGCTSSLWG